MNKQRLSREQLRIANALAARRPSNERTTSAAAWVAVEWYETVRDVADAIADRGSLVWTLFVAHAGYYGPPHCARQYFPHET